MHLYIFIVTTSKDQIGTLLINKLKSTGNQSESTGNQSELTGNQFLMSQIKCMLYLYNG